MSVPLCSLTKPFSSLKYMKYFAVYLQVVLMRVCRYQRQELLHSLAMSLLNLYRLWTATGILGGSFDLHALLLHVLGMEW